jgi:type IV secretion system protein TrbL
MATDIGSLDLNIVDAFLDTFIRYIDSGFGLVSGDVGFLTTALIGIDVTLAALWWAMDNDTDILGRLVKKVLYVGTFAFILGNFSHLADLIYRSFAGLGITASGGSMSADRLLHPGTIAGKGFTAAYPLIAKAADLMGFPEFFGNFLSIVVLLICWLLVVLAFFILAIQLFVTIVEFKLTALAGFVLVPLPSGTRPASRRARAGQCRVVGHQGYGAGGHHRYRLQLFRPDDWAGGRRSYCGPGVDSADGRADPVRPGHLRSRHRFWPRLGCAATRRGRGSRHRGRRGDYDWRCCRVGRAYGNGGGAGGMAIRAGTAMGSAASTAYRLGQETSGSTSVGAGLGGIATVASGAASQGLKTQPRAFPAQSAKALPKVNRLPGMPGARLPLPHPPTPLHPAPVQQAHRNLPIRLQHGRAICVPSRPPGIADMAMQTVKEGDRAAAPPIQISAKRSKIP